MTGRLQGEGGMREGREGQDLRLLKWKLAIFFLGAGFGIGGMAAESRLLVWIGSGILLLGVFLRFLPRFRGGSDSHSPAQEGRRSIGDDANDSAPSSFRGSGDRDTSSSQ